MKKIIALALAAFIGVTAPAVALGQNTYDDYNYNYNYDDYNYNYNYDDYYYDDTISDETAAAFGVGFMIFMGFFMLVALVLGVFTIWMIIDAARRDFDQKVMWILLMVFLGFIPAVVYYFMIKRKNVTGSGHKPAGTPPANPPATPPSTPPAQS